MKVTIPTRSNVASSGKQRYKREQEHGLILSRKKAKARTNSHPPFALPGTANPPHLTIAYNDRKTPPEIQNDDDTSQLGNEDSFTNVITGVNQNKKRQGKKCSFCNLATGHKIDRCPSRDEYKLKGLEYVLTDISYRRGIMTLIEDGMKVAGYFDPSRDRCCNDIPTKYFKYHVILKGLYLPMELSQQKRSMNNLYFKVTFINENGLIDRTSENWMLSGDLMSRVISTIGRKKKFLYDCTNSCAPEVDSK